MDNLVYNYDKKFTLLYNKRNIINNDKIIVSNPQNGQWLKLSLECYEIIKNMCKMNISINEMLDSLYDNEDRIYMNNLVEKLLEINVLVDNDMLKDINNLKIESISFAITHRCNLRCTHCCIDSDFQECSDILSTEEIFKCIDKILQLKPERLVLTGGEPLLREDFFDILKYSSNKFNGNVSVMSNATLIDESNAEIIAKLIDSIDISIDGVDEESCSIIRGEGVFEKVISAIKLLQKYGQTKISLSMVMTPNNKELLKEFDELCKKLNVKKILRGFENNMGRAKYNEQLLNKTYTHKKPDNSFVDSIPNFDNIKSGTCGAYYKQLSMTENGDLFPCDLLDDSIFKICNVLTVENLYEYIRNEKNYQGSFNFFQSLLPNVFDKCKNCKVNFFCLSCMHDVYKMKNDPNRFFRYCEGRKQYLYKAVWNEKI
jgi:Predicted Fe-S oxidoreductases